MFAGHENGAVGRRQGACRAGGQRTSGESALFALSIGPHGLTQYSDKKLIVIGNNRELILSLYQGSINMTYFSLKGMHMVKFS